MKLSWKKLMVIVSSLAFAAVMIVAFVLLAPDYDVVEDATGTLIYTAPDIGAREIVLGEDLTAIRVRDFSHIGVIEKVNYVPNEFVLPKKMPDQCQIVDLNSDFEFAEKGTLMFVILNLDPNDENFRDQFYSLEPYRVGDYVNMGFRLPKILSASTVYLGTQLSCRNGEIENYQFSEYSTYDQRTTEKFSSGTGPEIMNLKFYTKRHTLENEWQSAQVITIHYQSQGTSAAGINDFPLIGAPEDIENEAVVRLNILFSFLLLSLFTVGILVFISITKRTASFVPMAIVGVGLSMAMLAGYMLESKNSAPLIFVAVSSAALMVTLCGTTMAMEREFYKSRLAWRCSVPALVGAVLVFMIPFVSYDAASRLKQACTVLGVIGSITLLALVVAAACCERCQPDPFKMASSVLVSVVVLASLLFSNRAPFYLTSLFWLYSSILAIVLVGVFYIFAKTERSNAYLMENLHFEVDRKLNDIKAMVSERDELLRFITHDMKKPLVSSEAAIDSLLEREKNDENRKTLWMIKKNTDRVVTNFSEIAKYSHYSYIAEPSRTVNLKELCHKMYQFHLPDCTANGIVLKNLIKKDCRVFVKPNGLENVITNLIMNALEHAHCTTITLSAKLDNRNVLLFISDDGKGIDPSLDVFRPYISENHVENGGLGLYICKNTMESMNGSLSYDSDNHGTVFCISVLQS